MYTLKIKWFRYDFEDGGKCVDQTTLFIPADEVRVHGEITADTQMRAWEDGDFQDYKTISGLEDGCADKPIYNARLICVIRDNKTLWYLASFAWLLGVDGKTIERLTA